MPKFYLIYCTLVLVMFSYANASGHVYGSLFSTQNAAQKSANHYHK